METIKESEVDCKSKTANEKVKAEPQSNCYWYGKILVMYIIFFVVNKFNIEIHLLHISWNDYEHNLHKQHLFTFVPCMSIVPQWQGPKS